MNSHYSQCVPTPIDITTAIDGKFFDSPAASAWLTQDSASESASEAGLFTKGNAGGLTALFFAFGFFILVALVAGVGVGLAVAMGVKAKKRTTTSPPALPNRPEMKGMELRGIARGIPRSDIDAGMRPDTPGIRGV